MTRDFAKRNRPPRGKTTGRGGYQSRVPGWVWLFTGSVLGAFVMFLVYLADVPPQPTEFPELSLLDNTSPANDAPAVDDEKQPEQETEIPQPRFDFYQLLRENEVAKLEPPDAPIAPVDTGIQYTLQAGSFRDPANADRLRAELILLNLETKVETVKARNAETLHLVIVGPFTTKSQLAKARGTLAAKDIDSLVLQQNTAQNDG